MSQWILHLAAMLLVLIPNVLSRSVDLSRLSKNSIFLNPPKRNSKHGGGGGGEQGGSRPAPYLRIRSDGLPSHINALASESRVLECEAGGNPPPTIHWLKNGIRVSQDQFDNNLLSSPDDGNRDVAPHIGLSFTRSRLYLDCLEPRDSGIYSCVAENPYFKDSSSTRLSVISPQRNADAICIRKKSQGIPARIHMWTKTRLELAGSDVQVFCRSAGYPEPDVSWVGPDGSVLETSDKYQIMSNGDLIVRKIDWSDMGSYTCVSINAHGTDRTNTFLYPTKAEEKN